MRLNSFFLFALAVEGASSSSSSSKEMKEELSVGERLEVRETERASCKRLFELELNLARIPKMEPRFTDVLRSRPVVVN